ncbi:MAG: hypothetical protein KA408_05840 [Flavobacteriales bacterium]|nr:hypothetical protein [Flavobacteriales bacterium]
MLRIPTEWWSTHWFNDHNGYRFLAVGLHSRPARHVSLMRNRVSGMMMSIAREHHFTVPVMHVISIGSYWC